MLKTQRRFVERVREHLKEHDCRIVFGRGKELNCGGYRAAGYFSDGDKELRVARKHTLWFEVLIHEYCHFLQWTERSPVYRKSDKYNAIIDNWFNGKQYQSRVVDKAFDVVREMERDCEMRSIKLIKKHSLPVNVDRYSRMANCYIYVHYFMREYRKFWPFENDLMRSPSVLSQMPSNFRAQSHKKIPQRVYDVLSNCI
jgi:hypothetical protein